MSKTHTVQIFNDEKHGSPNRKVMGKIDVTYPALVTETADLPTMIRKMAYGNSVIQAATHIRKMLVAEKPHEDITAWAKKVNMKILETQGNTSPADYLDTAKAKQYRDASKLLGMLRDEAMANKKKAVNK